MVPDLSNKDISFHFLSISSSTRGSTGIDSIQLQKHIFQLVAELDIASYQGQCTGVDVLGFAVVLEVHFQLLTEVPGSSGKLLPTILQTLEKDISI